MRVHEGTKIPVGSLANSKLRALRKEAHEHFNQLYLSGRMSKYDAYAWLAAVLQAPRSEAHIGHLTEYYCKLVIKESEKLLEKAKPGGGNIIAFDGYSVETGRGKSAIGL